MSALVAAAPASAAIQSAQAVEDLRGLSIEDLANVQVTSVSRRPEPLSEAAAAVFVITSEDIRRSGATSLPEVLRLAPNLQVTRVNAQGYSISARGFNTTQASNKLLVLIDGRSVYTPLHAGVFWDQQQVMLEDIERIEVVSGPGGTLYGANAVNGVINVISRKARDTLGGVAVARHGNTETSGVARYGGRLSENATLRVYGKGFDRDHSVNVRGTALRDDWNGLLGGFRSDVAAGDNAFTFQGDIFDNALDPNSRIWGKNLLARWNRQLSGGSTLEVQAYYDAVDRVVPLVTDSVETYDLNAQHSFSFGDRHRVVWGGGARRNENAFDNRLNAFVLDPPTDTEHLANLFVQDSIALREDLTLTLGTKFEHSTNSGLDYLPNVRLAWQVTDQHMLWSAVSRAIRTPSRIDRGLTAPGVLSRASGGFTSEELTAYEIGYRGQPTGRTSLSVSLFFNDYDNLRVLATSPSTGLLVFDNKMEGHTYGAELWGDYRVLPWWRLSAGVNALQKRLTLEPGASTAALDQHQGNDPDYQFSLRSRMDVTRNVELDVALRRVDDLPSPMVPDYLELDVRVGWHVTDGLELSIAGFNLLDDHHPETGAAATRREVRRTVYAGGRVRF